MNAADKLSEIHMELKEKLMNEDSEKIRNWQKDAFHKQMIGGFRETKDADEGFRKAQKPWVRKLKEVSLLMYLKGEHKDTSHYFYYYSTRKLFCSLVDRALQ